MLHIICDNEIIKKDNLKIIRKENKKEKREKNT